MRQWSGVVLVATTVIGVVTAVGAAIAKGLVGDPVWFGLIGTSVSSFWVAFITYAREAKEHHTLVRAGLQASFAAKPGDDLPQTLLIHCIRSGFYGTSHIDPAVWLEYAQVILAQANVGTEEKIQLILLAYQTNRISTHGNRENYHFMHVLLRSVLSGGGNYSATATVAEINRPDADRFILEIPHIYHASRSRIRRILVAPDRASLAALPGDVRDKLCRVNNIVQMRLLITDTPVPNFGIYGSIAVGRLDERAASNEFNFDKGLVTTENQSFERYWLASKELTDEAIQNFSGG